VKDAIRSFSEECTNTLIIIKNTDMSQDNLAKLECTQCHSINYHSHRNKKTIKERLEVKKHCKKCKTHTMHKETK